MRRLHSLKISFFFLLPPSFHNRSSRDLYHPHLIRNSSGLGEFYLFFIFTLEDISWLYPSKLRKLLLEGQGPSMLSKSKENNMWTQNIGMTWAPGQLEGGRQRHRGVVSSSLLPTWHTCPSLYLINLILIIWRLTCLLADGVVLGHSIKATRPQFWAVCKT